MVFSQNHHSILSGVVSEVRQRLHIEEGNGGQEKGGGNNDKGVNAELQSEK